MIELVPMAYRVVNEVDAGSEGRGLAGLDNAKIAGAAGSGGSGTAVNGSGRKMDEDEEREAVFFRLEMLGYRVGQGLVERYVYAQRITSHLQRWNRFRQCTGPRHGKDREGLFQGHKLTVPSQILPR
jgi:hypothetical protein